MLSFPPGRVDAGACPLLPPVLLTSTRVSPFLCCLKRRSCGRFEVNAEGRALGGNLITTYAQLQIRHRCDRDERICR